MRVVLHPSGKGASDPCAFYRMFLPGRALQAAGHDIHIRHDFKYQAQYQPSVMGDRVVGIQGKTDGDVIVFQRPLRRQWYELMGVLQDRGHAVVVELDDAFHCVPPHNPAYRDVDPLTNPDRNYLWLERACERADWVVVTTQGLADHYGTHGRVSVIPNYVPQWYTEIPRRDLGEPPVIGWSGAVTTHGADLQVTRGAVGRAIRATEARHRVVGTGANVAAHLDAPEPEATGWVPISRYPYEMAKFDIGIVPLKGHRFNVRAKSWLKSLEWASLGVPVVASPTEDNRKAAALGLCSIAETPDEWYAECVTLILDKDWREERGSKAREVVREHLLVEQNAHKWMTAWEQAHHHRTGAAGT